MGFDWIDSVPLNSFEELCNAVRSANQRKAISATQFNHQSTRGHCILQLEINKPHEENPTQRVQCRMYVCDLAGTEPAADIVASLYQRVNLPDGTVEYKVCIVLCCVVLCCVMLSYVMLCYIKLYLNTCFWTSSWSPSHSSRRAILDGPSLGSVRQFGGSQHAM